MTARLEATFARARREGRAVVVAYLCVGDPSVEASVTIARALLGAGADVLELGAPFSDPTADGPAIARAATRAIAGGSSMRAAIEVGARLRRECEAPLVLFGYGNPIVVRGERETVRAVHAAGIDAMLVVDVPPEEGRELRDEARALGVHVIPLLTPTSSERRVEAVRAAGASGFVYYVSVTGVTGPQAASADDPFVSAARASARLRRELGLPVVVGFGIDGPEKARAAHAGGEGADGVVVGTAIVRAIEAAGTDIDRAARDAAAIVAALRAAV